MNPSRSGSFASPGRLEYRLPFGIKILVAFFAFGTLACAITVVALVFQGSPLDAIWRLNPEAHAGFATIGRPLALLLMFAVGLACAAAAVGLARGREWGRRLGIAILSLNLLGDLLSALLRHDSRTLIGLPIGGVMILYLLRHNRKDLSFLPPARGM